MRSPSLSLSLSLLAQYRCNACDMAIRIVTVSLIRVAAVGENNERNKAQFGDRAEAETETEVKETSQDGKIVSSFHGGNRTYFGSSISSRARHRELDIRHRADNYR